MIGVDDLRGVSNLCDSMEATSVSQWVITAKSRECTSFVSPDLFLTAATILVRKMSQDGAPELAAGGRWLDSK